MSEEKLKDHNLSNEKSAALIGIFQQVTGCSIDQMLDAAAERTNGVEFGPATLDMLKTIDETARKAGS